MGSRTRDTMTEIDERRARLDATISELENRMPAIGRAGKRVAGMLLGGGAGASALLFVGRKLLGRSSSKKHAAATPPQVTVKVLPGGAIFGAVAVAAIWGAVKIVEAQARAAGGPKATVKPLRAAEERGA